MAENLKNLIPKKAEKPAAKPKSVKKTNKPKPTAKKTRTAKAKTDESKAFGHLTKEKVIKALELKNGLVSVAARFLKVSPQTIYNWRDKEPEVAAAILNARNEIVDAAEHGLRGAVLGGEGWAVCFTLKTLGKDRGYMETQKHEVTGKDGKPIEQKLIIEIIDTNETPNK